MRLVQQSESEVTCSVSVAVFRQVVAVVGLRDIASASAGFAVVKKGKDKKTGQPVAIKVGCTAANRSTLWL